MRMRIASSSGSRGRGGAWGETDESRCSTAMMNDEEAELWGQVHGIDTTGSQILADLKKLSAGHLSDDEASELFSDLVRDHHTCTAGYAAIPYLLSDGLQVSAETHFSAAHAASLILGFAGGAASPPVPPSLQPNVADEVKRRALSQLLGAASQCDLGGDDVLCLASAALLVEGRSDEYFHLVGKL